MLFRGSGRKLQKHVQQVANEVHQLRADLTNRLPQVEEECAGMRLQRMIRGIHEIAELAIRQGLPLLSRLGQAFVRRLRRFRPARVEAGRERRA
jgi:hypothetical protein